MASLSSFRQVVMQRDAAITDSMHFITDFKDKKTDLATKTFHESQPLAFAKNLMHQLDVIVDRFANRTMSLGCNWFERLPREIMMLLFSFVSLETLITLPTICKLFNELLDEEVWQQRCLEWWEENDLQKQNKLESVVLQAKSLANRTWKYFAHCFTSSNCLGYRFLKDDHGLIEIGQFTLGKLSRWGIKIFKKENNVSCCMGDIDKDGTFTGKGTVVWKSGTTYIGDLRHNLRHGGALETYDDGGAYTGQFFNDQRSGWGKCKYPGGSYYEGQYEDNMCNGWGRMTWPSCNYQYEGKFKDGVPEDYWSAQPPIIRKAITKNYCTGSVTGRTNYPQQCFTCKECSKYFCLVCWLHHQDTHEKGDWLWGEFYCSCLDHPSSCAFKKRISPQKRKLIKRRRWR